VLDPAKQLLAPSEFFFRRDAGFEQSDNLGSQRAAIFFSALAKGFVDLLGHVFDEECGQETSYGKPGRSLGTV